MSKVSHEAGLTAHRFDEFETGLLPVLRQFLLSYETPDSQAWQRAYIVAAERWGEAIGLPAAHALMKLLRAVLDCRDRQFAFIGPFDLELRGTLTPDEAALLQMLHHMRRDQTPGAREAIAEVTGGHMDPHVIRAGLAFAHRFPAGQAAARPDPPRLRVVA
ncbi:hypothetical protein K3723_01675 [Leisingera caerulea]|uniref:hypothetical protein n=1 Tax=Leisingera caerulea TaxID=506591 RepID=UPI0021A7A5E9|nr:hypothetical protein [Leisingera caerulea]UWQ63037.1 hypothetical protein K3723_01675 [Leisingera caerulea]